MFTSDFQIGIQGFTNVEFSENYGGVKFRLEQTDTLSDEGSFTRFDPIDLSRYYQEVEGTLNFIVEGPTASGIIYMVRKLEAICDNTIKFTEGLSSRATYFQVNSSFFCLLKAARVTWKSSPSDVERLKKVKLSIDYTRAGLIGELQSYGGFATDKQLPTVASGVTTTTLHTIEYPASLAITLYNQHKYFPSGYILVAENSAFIKQTTGDTLYQGTAPAADYRTALVNETANNQSGSFIMRFQPVNLSTFVTSGFIGDSSQIGSDIPTNEMDVYAVVKTTVTDVNWTVKVVSQAKYGPNIETDPVIIPYTQYPKVYYLGRLSSPAYLGGSIFRLSITPSRASGYFYVDNVVLHDATRITSRAILIDGIVDDKVTASGNFVLYIKNNYFPFVDLDYTFLPDPFIYAAHSKSAANTPVTYRGNAFVYAGSMDGKNTTVFMTILAPGSTYGTASGLNNWNSSDRANRKTRYTFSYLSYKNASKAFVTTL